MYIKYVLINDFNIIINDFIIINEIYGMHEILMRNKTNIKKYQFLIK